MALNDIKNKISEYSIQVASNSDDIKDLWRLYGCLSEYWARIQDIFGLYDIRVVRTIKRMCYLRLHKEKETPTINPKTYELLLQFRDYVYMLAQRANLGISTEKSVYGEFYKAKKGIVE